MSSLVPVAVIVKKFSYPEGDVCQWKAELFNPSDLLKNQFLAAKISLPRASMTSPIQVIENTIVEEPRVLGNGWGISKSIIIKTTYNDRANVLGPGSQILIDSKNFRELGQSEFYLYELKGFFLTSEEYNKQQTDEVVEIIEKNFRGNIQESYLKIKSLGREECWELPLSAVDSIDFVNKQIILVNLDSWKEALLS